MSKPMSKIAFGKLLRAIGIDTRQGRNAKVYRCSWEEVYRAFDTRGWIHEMDELPRPPAFGGQEPETEAERQERELAAVVEDLKGKGSS